MRELAAFLAGQVEAHVSGLPCTSIADLDRAESELAASDQARQAADAEARSATKAKALEKARRDAEIAVLSERDNGMALAACCWWRRAGRRQCLLFAQRNEARNVRIAGGAGGVLLLAAIVTWWCAPRSNRSRRARRTSSPPPARRPAPPSGGATDGTGRLVCVIDTQRSRVTVSDITDVAGMERGRLRQRPGAHGLAQDGWTQILVPDGERRFGQPLRPGNADPHCRAVPDEP
jgi:hypothetical protein